MAFESAITGRTVFGNKRVHFGTFTNGASDAGGNINTGLRSCEAMLLQHGGAGAVASAPAVNETLPAAGSAITIVTTAGADGYWTAVGY
jgi:hypothetical protein